MTAGSKFLSGGVQLSAGYAAQHALIFLRNVLIARLIGPDNFGIVVTFALIISALEVVSDLGVEQFIVRAPDGDLPELQNTLHFVQVVRAVFISAGIFLAADVIAAIFKVPEVAWAYRILAILPLLKGFVHLDMRRMQRSMTYLPSIVVAVSSVSTGLIVAVAFALAWRSYEVMIWALFVETAVMVLASHIVAERRYALAIFRPALSDVWAFGWPLMLNGVVLFLMSQGDRIIIGSTFSVRELANYAVATTLTGGPVLLMLKITGTLYVPFLSSLGDRPDTQAQRYEICGAISALSCMAVCLPLMFYGSSLVTLIFSDKYEVPLLLITWLAIGAGARVLRSWSIAVALASGNTRDILYANILRVFGFLAAIGAVNLGYGVVGVAASIAGGEVMALIFAIERSDRTLASRSIVGRNLYVLFLVTVSLGIASIESQYVVASASIKLLVFLVLSGASVCLILGISPAARTPIAEMSARIIRRALQNWRSG